NSPTSPRRRSAPAGRSLAAVTVMALRMAVRRVVLSAEGNSGTMLTQRDQQLLLALLLKVRLLSLRQIAAGGWQDEVANARRRLRMLAAGGLVRPLTVSARSLPAQHSLTFWKSRRLCSAS